MWRKSGFERLGDFSELWPAFIKAASCFGAYAPAALRPDIQPAELLSELQRASREAAARAEAEAPRSFGVAGFDVLIRGAGVAVTFGSGRSIVRLAPETSTVWALSVGSRSEDVDASFESQVERWKATGFPLPRWLHDDELCP